MTGLRACKQSSASRWEPRNLRQQTKDGNEEMGCIEDAEGMDIDDNSQEQEQEGTQSTSAEELLSKMVAGARKRHMANKKNVLESYDRTSKNVEDSIHTLFDEHEAQSSLVHKAQLKRLKDLLAHKAKLEAAMEARLTTLRESYDAHSRDLETVLNRRIKEMK